MAAKKTTSKKTNEKGYVEFNYSDGDRFEYSGRIYVDKKREAGKLTIYPMSLCLNGQITIKACSFYETEKNMWVGGPQYKSGDEYKDFIYFDKSINDEMDTLAETIKAAIDEG